ncbi:MULTISPECIES: filamentous haemagglutinin family protein [Methylomonas]|uniref:Filamentous haemagglutinin FhaB/tRNA nuclease CdiA-like TPS domain-containing protein n=1 Tax=Methylomonas koyamae TaxID=702114 RepID=A0A177NUX7_9GAMM|nr:filamentous haemagglutinin family protein [Methylomonas koyamae]OAI21394.1 hypothetical protein A1355_02645 [Methylomonas koyamae]
MKSQRSPFSFKLAPLAVCIRRILAGGLLAGAGGELLADAGLPVAVGAGASPGSSIAELANPALHPTIDVGHASASYSADGQKLTINQTTAKTVLDWQSFNVDAGKSVQFAQPGSGSIALNNIHQLDASKIYGNLSANGQVYLVNANGFVFGKGASVNVNSLVATTLKIEDEVFDKGIANVVDAGATGINPPPVAALTGDGAVYRDLGNGQREKIRILVENGAAISAANSGRVLMAAPDVENDGTITAPDGQVLLVGATDKVYLQASDSSDVRGLLVEVATGGSVENVGKILTERGNTTMLGFAVSQQGVVSASTSVALNGSVRLLAREGAQLTGTSTYKLKPKTTTRAQAGEDGLGRQARVVLDGGSLTEVALDASGGTAVDEQAQPRSRIDIEAGTIRLKNGAQIVAHAGDVNLIASAQPDAPLTQNIAGNASRIVLEQGSKIDVSGVKNVELAMSSNIVDLELRNYELRDAPLQKDGILHGKTVKVDVRDGTTLADASGAIAKRPHSVFERSIGAGTISLQSEGDLIVQTGANLDISGGYLSYLGGYVDTTQLLSDGRLFDLATANPNRTYQQIVSGRHYEAAYRQGGAAGTLSIRTQAARLDGNVFADTVGGLYQRDPTSAAAGGELNLDLAWSNTASQTVAFVGAANGGGEDIANVLALTPALFGHGLNHFELKTLGRFTIDAGVVLNLAAGGGFTVRAGTIDVQGSLIAPAGDVALTSVSGDLDGKLTLGTASRIDTSGLWINDIRDGRANSLQTLWLDGGDIALQAGGGLLLARGSSLAANGGARMTATHKVTGGTGGDIALKNNNASGGLSEFQLDATLSAVGLRQNGSLSIGTSRVEIANGAGQPIVTDGTLYLSSGWLQNANFGAYALTTTDGAVKIADNTRWQLRQTNWQLNGNALNVASGTPLSELVHLVLLPDYQRHAVDLSLTHVSQTSFTADGDSGGLLIGANAWLGADWGARFNLTSDSSIRIDGTLSAPAGTINIALTASDSDYDPNLGIFLGGLGQLNAVGTGVLTPNGAGLTQGDVKAGGTVTLTAARGYIAASAASSIDVSGGQARLDIVNAKGRTKQTIASAGGTINLTAAEGLILQGQLLAQTGAGSGAAGGVSGGTLNLALDTRGRAVGEFTTFPTGERVIRIGAEAEVLSSDVEAAIAAGVVPARLNGLAYIGARQIAQSGADRLSLANLSNGEIRFDGPVALNLEQSLTLDAPLIGHVGSGSAVLSANVVNLGSSLNRTVSGSPGAADTEDRLTFNANLINLFGATAIGGFAETRLLSNGDLRLTGINPNAEADLLGALKLAGNLTLGAREIYPTTLSQYTIAIDAAVNPDGTVTVLPGVGDSATPLSAAGKLTIAAAHIQSQGRLLAPFGNIELNAGSSLALLDGSVTSVSADTVIPFGRTQGGLDWLYPLAGFSNVQTATPAKSIVLSGPDINLAAGASVNLNGGGDLSAFEFVAGAGGSLDVLDTAGAYAILPAYSADFAAYDPIEFAKSGLSFGDSLHLSAALGKPGDNQYLAAGDYVLLPAHYALLPHAFLVTPQADTLDMAASTSGSLVDGTAVIAGYRYTANTGIAASRWSGFAVETGDVARTRSEYRETTASEFFGAKGAGLPQDAGNLALLAQGRLTLAADISATAAAGGLGGLLDIGANKISVVQDLNATAPADGVVVLAEQLNRLNVDSLLLGGRRQRGAADTRLSVSAETVTLGDGVRLQGREILLAARDRVGVGANAGVASSGKLDRSDAMLNVVNADGSSDGALLRVSAAAPTQVLRSAAALSGATGILEVESGAELSSGGSILLDGSRDVAFNGTIAMNGGDLALSSSRITLGGDGTAAGLNLSDSSLNGLNADRIALNSYNAIDFAGALHLAVKELTLNAANLRGVAGGQTASIVADTITLTHTGRAAAAQTLAGDMRLDLSARNSLSLAEGEYAWSGFGQVALSAGVALIDDGTATIHSTADLAVTAPVWTASAGANTVIELGGHDLTVGAGNGGAVGGGLGARLTVNARDIVQQGRIELAAGGVTLNAGRDLTVGGDIDAAGRVVNLADAVAYAGGGYISLTAEQGKLAILNGARLDVSGSSLGGDAGSLNLAAANGELTLAGSLVGHAHAGAVGGGLALDSQTLSPAQWAGLLGQLHGGGFNGDIAIRQRLGDITITAGQSLQATNITLAAGSGSLTVAGELSVSGAQAGKLQLAAGDALAILAGAKLGAVSSGTDKAGGSITLTSTDADGDGLEGVAIAAGAALDVSGGGAGGDVEVIVNRNGDDDAAVDIAAGSVAGAASLKVAAMAHYATDTITNAQIKQWYDDTRVFMTAAADNADLSGRLGGFTLQPGLDVQGSGSLDLNLSENLATATWTRVGSAGVWRTKLDNIAGAVQALRRLNSDGSVSKEYSYFSPASSNIPCTLTNCALNAGTYYFDANPNSPTYRTLFFKGSTNANPRTLSGLTEFNGWDLALPYANGQDWHFGAEQVPGLLVIRAAENLDINQNLSDGIASYDGKQLNALLDTSRAWGSREVLQTGASWSYQLVAGADLSSANLMGLLSAPALGTGNLTVGANSRIRTGTGDIEIAAAGNIKLTDWTSAIYTMGRADTVDRYGSLTGFTVSNEFFVEYPLAGGDLSLKAGGDIIGAVSSQFLSDWLQRGSVSSPANDGTLTGATAWGIAFDAPATFNGQNQSFGFRENLGALGGGTIDVNAGRDILNLSVMLPTSAKLTGAVDADGNIAESPPLIRGGGDLNLRAGGDIAGGVFFVDKGNANLKAGGAITASRADPDAPEGSVGYAAGPIFAIGDSVFNVQAATGIAVGAVVNPFGVPPANNPASNTTIVNSYFFNYGPGSGIALQTLAGDIDFNNDAELINELAKTFPTANSDPQTYISLAATELMSNYYPGNLTGHALSGDINIHNSMLLFPSSGGTLDLAAWGNLTLGIDTLSSSEIRQLDADPNLLPSVLTPTNTSGNWPEHADVSVHANDSRSNRLIAAHGSIVGIGSASVITAKATTFYAGLDFKNLGVAMQNLHADDVSSISAGRDILYELIRNPTTGEFNGTIAQIELAGPGLLNVWAGRNIDLGVSGGIISVGNLHNVALPSQGADISVLAGNRFSDSTAPLEDFLNTYVVSGNYQSLRASLEQQTTPIGRLQIALAVLFDEIRASAKAAAMTTGAKQQAAYQRGYDAIALLFPDAPAGDIKLFFSRIQTVQGGDVNLLAPGGMINVGLASGFTGGKADQADLGIMAQREGNINILVKNDLQVNQQRVFTLAGGDITVWSSEGNIDAGRGAKAALATAAPRISIDKSTSQLIVEFPPTISGSGIRAQSGYNSDRIGNVVLAAPKGVVDAGEAGIGGQNVTIAATAVIGASNIQVLGSSIGFGQILALPTMPDNAGAAAAAASRSASTNEAAAEQQTDDSAAGRSVKVALLDSQLLGFGACSLADIKSGKAGCGD